MDENKRYILKLSRTQQRGFNKPIYGYDIETYDDNKKFYCGSIFGKDYQKTFFNKDDVIKELHHKRFRNSYIAATNLSFDFMGTFYNKSAEMGFNLLFRGSELIIAKTYTRKGKFYRFRKEAGVGHSITFIDTRNYAALSVEKLGEILKHKKFDTPIFIGKKPRNQIEKDMLVNYNMRDAEISQKSIDFFYKSFINLGATPKPTIAATSMSLFKNKYLYSDYFVHEPSLLLEQFKSYYGGRCEAFGRGLIRNYKYYDFNSLYPFVMTKKFPDPNTLRITYKNDINYIKEYEGISDVEIECPNMQYPLLAFRTDVKLLFPIGKFRAFYTHVELRKAIKLGYKIIHIHKMYYFKATIEPFKEFVIDLYELRLKYKKEKNPMEYIVKIMLNSLYGKFGQRFWDRDNWQPFNLTLEELHKLDSFERFGNYIRTVMKQTRPANFCFPIWASYITAYARLHLYDYIKKSKAVYCDTDSLLTKKDFGDSNKLGELKLENSVRYGYIVKPKFYALINDHGDEIVKIKGLGVRLTLGQFKDFLYNPKKAYKKFVKFKEAMRRDLLPNEIIDMTKNMKLEDEKRIWDNKFEPNEYEPSKPINMNAV